MRQYSLINLFQSPDINIKGATIATARMPVNLVASAAPNKTPPRSILVHDLEAIVKTASPENPREVMIMSVAKK